MKRIFSKRDLARLILPLIVELLLALLVGMIDSVMVASVGEAAVSGVSLIDTVFQLLVYIFSAFGTGGAVVAGQYLGAGKQKNARETVDQLVWFSALVSVASWRSSTRFAASCWGGCSAPSPRRSMAMRTGICSLRRCPSPRCPSMNRARRSFGRWAAPR